MYNLEMPIQFNLNSIRGFDAAARNLSFTLAANELHVTQGAISRQIAALERDIGKALFIRLTRQIALTEAGAEFYKVVENVLEVLNRSVSRIKGTPPQQILTVSILPTLGTVWLMPRLHMFTQANPEIEVRVVTSIEPAELKAAAIDVAIRVGPRPDHVYAPGAPRIDLHMTKHWEDVQVRELFGDTLVPVVSRNVTAALKGAPPRDILGRLPLIHMSTRRYGWPDWLYAHGIQLPPDHKALEFGHFFMALEAARAGRGVALVPAALLPDLGYRRRLQVLDFPFTPSAGAYYALTLGARSTNPSLQRFMAWLDSESAALNSRMRRLLAPDRPVLP
jgi:LysR family transcriptional regulator, glycine cleavage system transcriptional activator